MNEQSFTASNGWHTGATCLYATDGRIALLQSDTDRAREFFLEERDHELGRWRDPEAPGYVCYPEGDNGVCVLRESDCGRLSRNRDSRAMVSVFDAVAARFFAAHPVRRAQTVPAAPGLYVSREAFDRGYDPARTVMYQVDADGQWQSDAFYKWEDCPVSDLPSDLVRLVPEEAQ